MEDENKIETADEASLKARRKFLKTAAGVAVTAPAVTMLLAAQSKAGVVSCERDPYTGQQIPGQPPNCEFDPVWRRGCKAKAWHEDSVKLFLASTPMEEENRIETAEEGHLAGRRKFLKTAAKVAVTAPAVTMLLAAPTKSYAGSTNDICRFDPYTKDILNEPCDIAEP